MQRDSLPVTGERALFQGLPRGLTQCFTGSNQQEV